jgi:hypothetical protein
MVLWYGAVRLTSSLLMGYDLSYIIYSDVQSKYQRF